MPQGQPKGAIADTEGPAESEETKAQGRPAGAVVFPRHSLTEALVVPRVIWEEFAGKPTLLLDVASKLKSGRNEPYQPTSSSFRDLIRSAQRYGLIEGSWHPDVGKKSISLSALGRSIVAPTTKDDVNASMRAALEHPQVLKDFLESIQGNIIPSDLVCMNTLIRDHHLSKGDAQVCLRVIMKNVRELGIGQEQGGKTWLRLDKLSVEHVAVPQTPEEEEGGGEQEEATEENPLPLPEQALPPPTPQKPKQIFVAHGKNRKPLEQLKNILGQFKVPYVVATEEPNKGKVIPEKVLGLMRDCSSGIFIFTADEILKDSDGKEVVRPNDNVVFELGAGVALYGNQIVIMKEEGVTFGSDFDAYVRITFEKDKLEAKGLEIMKEIINMGFLKWSTS